MTNFRHLTKFELSEYHQGAFDAEKHQEIGKHLLICPECRKLLPLPSVEKFWSAIMTEKGAEVISAKEKKNFSFFTALLGFRNSYSNLIWSGATLILLFGFSYLIWSGIENDPKEIARFYENINEVGSEKEFPLAEVSTDESDRDSKTNSNPTVSAPTTRKLKEDLPKSRSKGVTDLSQKQQRKLPENRDRIAETRGVVERCKDEENIELEFTADQENFVFKWKKVPKAVKYHLYISDDEEILIDEYETETETTFIMKKRLDPLKTYKWKIIVTLDNGQTVAGPSSKFTIRDFHINQKKSGKKQNSDIRCLATK